MATFISHSPAETVSLGREWAGQAQLGWLIGLSGDLGAGKTQLVNGLAAGLGVARRASSPTFTLIHEYSGGRLPMFHLDLYRLETRDQVIAAGLEPYLIRPRGVAVVEWIEHWLGCDGLPPGGFYRRVQIKTLGETEREIIYEDFGG